MLDEDVAVSIVREAFVLMMMLSAPILLAALVVGLAVGVLQAMTQVQEQTLSFVPKILGMGAVAAIALPWLFRSIMDFSALMFSFPS